MDKLHILDGAFLPFGNKRLHGKDHPPHFQWVPCAEEGDPNETVVVTDTYLNRDVKAKKLIAWLLEPPGFRQMNYDYVLSHPDKFDYIITYAEFMHQALPDKCLYYSMGYTMLTEEQYMNVPEKRDQNISFILSPKMAATGHVFRHEIDKAITKKGLGEWVDVFGLDGFVPKWDCLSNYRFTICVMGEKYNWCIDEKIMDCFLSKTIPIFWGYPDITERYHADGIFSFDTIDQLIPILEDVIADGEAIYNDPAVQKGMKFNYRRALYNCKIADEEYMWYYHKDKLFG